MIRKKKKWTKVRKLPNRKKRNFDRVMVPMKIKNNQFYDEPTIPTLTKKTIRHQQHYHHSFLLYKNSILYLCQWSTIARGRGWKGILFLVVFVVLFLLSLFNPYQGGRPRNERRNLCAPLKIHKTMFLQSMSKGFFEIKILQKLETKPWVPAQVAKVRQHDA